jgi:regulator of replication initiation timing
MKKLLLLPLLFLLGCANGEVYNLEAETIEVDTVLENSQKHLDTATLVYHQSDSIAKDQVVKIVKEISYLNTEVEKYKEVLSKQTIATEKIVYKIDTVYIETKKNFWGKEKTNTTIKSDSVITEKVDTTQNQLK